MATTAQIEANRRNAQFSTGPRTDDGRARSSQNARTHGIFSSHPVIPGERVEEYERHQLSFIAACRPQDPIQLALVEQMADSEWKRRRLNRLEAGMFQRLYEHETTIETRMGASGIREHSYPEDEREQTIARMSIAAYRAETHQDLFNRYSRYEAHQTRTFHRSLHDFIKLRDKQEKEETNPISPELTANSAVEPEEAPLASQPVSVSQDEPEQPAAESQPDSPAPAGDAAAETNPIPANPVSNQQPATSSMDSGRSRRLARFRERYNSSASSVQPSQSSPNPPGKETEEIPDAA